MKTLLSFVLLIRHNILSVIFALLTFENSILYLDATSTPWKYDVRLWDEGIVYYQIGPKFNESVHETIHEAMNEISKKTCIRFKERTHQPDFIIFRPKWNDGCHTKIGCHGGHQIINLDPSRCIQHGRIMHEILHALGFYHEHQRPDRDDYIKIFWNNIKPDGYLQFKKVSMDNLMEYPYDYGSIMHYSNVSQVAAIDPAEPILLPKKHTSVFGQRHELSKRDVAKINAVYNCKRNNDDLKM